MCPFIVPTGTTHPGLLGQSWLWTLHLQVITDSFSQVSIAWPSTSLPAGVGLLQPSHPLSSLGWGLCEQLTSKLGWISADHAGRAEMSPALPESEVFLREPPRWVIHFVDSLHGSQTTWRNLAKGLQLQDS